MNAEQVLSALGRIDDKYILEAAAYERKGKSRWLSWGVMAACFGLIVTAAVTLPRLGQKPGAVTPSAGPEPSTPTVSAGVLPGGKEQRAVVRLDGVAVNEAEGVAPDASRRPYDPERYTEEVWGEEEIADYYGWTLTPRYLPEGLSDGGTGAFGRAVRSRETGELMEDQMGRSFWSGFYEDGSPKSDDDLYIPTGFTLLASRLGILRCGILLTDGVQTTDFGGVSVTIAHCSMPHGPYDPTRRAPNGLSNMPAGYYDIYTASFTLEGVEYEIEGQRLELEEIVRVTASVISELSGQEISVE